MTDAESGQSTDEEVPVTGRGKLESERLVQNISKRKRFGTAEMGGKMYR